MDTKTYFVLVYLVTIVVCFLGVYFHMIDPSFLVSALSLVFGHGTGLMTPTPGEGK